MSAKGTERAKKAWKTIRKSGRLTRIEINVRTTKQRIGTLSIEPNAIGLTLPRRRDPIMKSWEEFEDWMKNT